MLRYSDPEGGGGGGGVMKSWGHQKGGSPDFTMRNRPFNAHQK